MSDYPMSKDGDECPLCERTDAHNHGYPNSDGENTMTVSELEKQLAEAHAREDALRAECDARGEAALTCLSIQELNTICEIMEAPAFKNGGTLLDAVFAMEQRLIQAERSRDEMEKQRNEAEAAVKRMAIAIEPTEMNRALVAASTAAQRAEMALGRLDSPEWRSKMQEAISTSPTAFAASRLAVEIIDEMTAIAKVR